MRIVCPACTATYDVPDRLLGTGKRLRCARCAHEWAPPEMAPPPPPPAVHAPPLLLEPHPPEPRPPDPGLLEPRRPDPPLQAGPKPRPPVRATRSARTAVLLALGLSVLVLAGLLAAGVVWRAVVMQVFPPSRLLFGLLGLG